MEEIVEQRTASEPVTRKTVEDFLKAIGEGAVGPEEVERLAAFAVRFQLNPFLREVHMITSHEKGQKRTVVVVGYEVYLKKAERTGKLDGWKAWTTGEGDDLKALLEIYRHDWSHPFCHEVHFAEAVQRNDDGTPTNFWSRMPRFQLRKVCIAQGFRLCFPEELGGIPYEPTELSSEQPLLAGSKDKPSGPEVPKVGPKSAFAELNDYLTNNASAFTPKHLRWIQDQLEKAPTLEKAKAMLGYARKVVLQGGDPSESSRPPRTYGSRAARREPSPEPTF